MICDQSSFIERVNEWLTVLKNYNLPNWSELPQIDLYMDQVVILLDQYLKLFDESSSEEKTVTPAMINNYVKMKIVPAPIKKKYSKKHLAHLIMVCTLKKSLSIATIKNLLPLELTEEQTKELYETFVKNHSVSLKYIVEDVEQMLDKVQSSQDIDSKFLKNTIMQFALSSNIGIVLTEKMLLEGSESEEPIEKNDVKQSEKNAQ